MGNAAYRQTTTNQYADQDVKNFMQIDLPKFVMQSKIGNGKFMKSYIMRVETTPLVVKVYMKLPDEDLMIPAIQLTFLWKTISPTKYPNLMPYQIWIKSNTRIKSPNLPVYLVRQYFHSNLYDRLSTRPFLLEIEKYWIIFQLLKCLEICHHHQIIHGDLKPENIMCTTSNWIVLTDFSPFKPVYIPDDDTTDFQYYFESSINTRHRCYIAPERFVRKPASTKLNVLGGSNRSSGNKSITGRINGIENTQGIGLLPSMDVFSLGCVMAEILLDGTALLDLPAMLQYLSSVTDSLAPLTPGVTNLYQSAASIPTVMEEITSPTSNTNNTTNTNTTNTTGGEDNPAKQLLQRIKHPFMRAVITDMTQKIPERRLSVTEYLKILQTSTTQGGAEENNTGVSAVLPTYFEHCIYPLYLKLHYQGITPDDRIAILTEMYGDILQAITGMIDEEGKSFFALHGNPINRLIAPPQTTATNNNTGASASTKSTTNQSNVNNLMLLLPAINQLLTPSNDATATATATLPEKVLRARYDRKKKLNTMEEKDSKEKQEVQKEEEEVLQSWSEVACEDLIAKTKTRLQKLDAFINQTLHTTAAASVATSSQTKELNSKASNNKLVKELFAKLRLSDNELKATTTTTTTIEEQQEESSSRGFPFPKREKNFFSIPNLPDLIDANLLTSNAPTTNAAANATTAASASTSGRQTFEGLVIIVDLLASNYRHVKFASSKIVCIMMLGRIGRYCSDPVILQRIIPLILHILEHEQLVILKILAIHILTNLLVGIEHLELIESSYFPLYVFPVLNRAIKDSHTSTTGTSSGAGNATGSVASGGTGTSSSGRGGGMDTNVSSAGGGVGEMILRMTMMECLGTIALTAKRFLVLSQQLYPNIASSTANNTTTATNSTSSTIEDSSMMSTLNGNAALSYDEKLNHLTDTIARWISELIVEHGGASSANGGGSFIASNPNASSYPNGPTIGSSYALPSSNPSTLDNTTSAANNSNNNIYSNVARRTRVGINLDTAIKKVFLQHILELCWFFGPEMTMERLLTQLLTFLNDPDWELRYAFCQAIPWISAFLGPVVTCEFIIPCLENTLYHSEEKVTIATIQAFHTLVALGLVSTTNKPNLLVEFIGRCSSLVLHPSCGIRLAAIQVIVVIAQTQGEMFTFAYVYPLMEKYLYRMTSSSSVSSHERSKQEKHWLLSQFTSMTSLLPVIIPPLSRTTLSQALQQQLFALWCEQQELAEIQQQSNSPKAGAAASNGGMNALNPNQRQQVFQQMFMQYYPWLYASSIPSSITAAQAQPMHHQYPGRMSMTSTSGFDSLFVGLTEEQKVEAIRPYLLQSARELYTKTLRWRIAATGNVTNPSQVLPPPVPITNANRLVAARGSTTNRSGSITGAPSVSSSQAIATMLLLHRATDLEYNMFVWINAIVFENHVHTFTIPYMKSTNYFLPMTATTTTSTGNTTMNTTNNATNPTNSITNAGTTGGNNATAAVGGQVLYSLPDEWRQNGIYFTNDDLKNFWKMRTLFTGLSYTSRDLSRSATWRGRVESLPPMFSGLNVSMSSWLASLGPGQGLDEQYQSLREDTMVMSMESMKRLADNKEGEIDCVPEDALSIPYYQLHLYATYYSHHRRISYYAAMNSLAYLRQVRSMNIPPLPGDFGALFPLPPLPGPDQVSGMGSPVSNAGGNGAIGGRSGGGGANANNGNDDTGDFSSANNTTSGPTTGGNNATSGGVGGANRAGSAGAAGNIGNSSTSIPPWRPRENTLILSLREHTGPVNRLIVSADQGYFASASADGTVKIWQSKSLDKVAFPRSVAVYNGHQQSPILDAVGLENSHSIATASSDGSVHIFRVDMLPTPPTNTGPGTGPGGGTPSSTGNAANNPSEMNNWINSSTSRIMGTTLLRMASTGITSPDPRSQAVVAIQHYVNDVCSVLTYVTSSGSVFAHDLRTSKPVFRYEMRPELGYTTSMTTAPDRHWLALGTSQGVVALYDLRYNTLSGLWRHSSAGPIYRLASSKAIRSNSNNNMEGVGGLGGTEGAYLFVAAGRNEAGVFGLPEAGECIKSFRSLPYNESSAPLTPLPRLDPLPLPSHPHAPMTSLFPHHPHNHYGFSSSTSSSSYSMHYPFTASAQSTSRLAQLLQKKDLVSTLSDWSSLPSNNTTGHSSSSSLQHIAALRASVFSPVEAFANNPLPTTVPMYASSAAAGSAATSDHEVRAMIGRISASSSSYLITAGSDKHIRFWDFRTPDQCYTVAGLELAQPKSIYTARSPGPGVTGMNATTTMTSGNSSNNNISTGLATPSSASSSSNNIPNMTNTTSSNNNKLFVCYNAQIPSLDKILQSQLPIREQRGVTTPSVNFKDGILDLKDLDYPMKCLIAGSRSGEIKIWR